MDISSATQNVVAMIASLGMGETGPADLCNPSCSDGEFLPLEDGDFAEMRKLMADAKDSALKAIQENRKGLLLLAVRLLSKPEILGPEVQSVLEEGGVIPGKLPSAMESFEIALGNEGIERNEDRWSA
jgi:ATP-dependent Zn protease